MKKLFLLLFLCLNLHNVEGQVSLETQLGGSQFIGIGVNASTRILHSFKGSKYLRPSIGIGYLHPAWSDNTVSLNLGLDYHFKDFGVGVEYSQFFEVKYGEDHTSGFVGYIIYPHLAYQVYFKKPFYLRFTGGAYFAFTHSQFEGDVVPGAGISFGYTFLSKD